MKKSELRKIIREEIKALSSTELNQLETLISDVTVPMNKVFKFANATIKSSDPKLYKKLITAFKAWADFDDYLYQVYESI